MSVNLSSSTWPFSTLVPNEHFERQQYVRVCFPNGRTEIGFVTDLSEDFITVYTIQGYDINVPKHFVKRAFLLVLDLNGVLVARGRGSFVHRPHVKEFMKFVFSNFVVAVWTSGLERSSSLIVESVFNGYQDRLLFKFYRDACLPQPTRENPYGTVKDLQRIFDTYPKSFHSVNTIIVDDSPCKCSHPDIALCPVPFKDPDTQKQDDGLKKAMETLQEVLDADSHAPLIRAAEQRLTQLTQEEQGDGVPLAAPLGAALVHSITQGKAKTTAVTQQHKQIKDRRAEREEMNLWKARLCCQYLRGCCRHQACRFSHDHDDGVRPCSHKNRCSHGHASRWIAATTMDQPLERQGGWPSNQPGRPPRRRNKSPRYT